jgi:hypothetical protein
MSILPCFTYFFSCLASRALRDPRSIGVLQDRHPDWKSNVKFPQINAPSNVDQHFGPK